MIFVSGQAFGLHIYKNNLDLIIAEYNKANELSIINDDEELFFAQ